MNNNDEENQPGAEVVASEASLDVGMTEETTGKTDGTEATADSALGDSEHEPEDALNKQAAEGTDDTSESGKDWLVDTGLAAAINPQNDVPEESSQDGYAGDADQESAESDFYDDDVTDGEECGDWEVDEPEDEDYDDDLAESDDEDDLGEDEQASLAYSASEDLAPQQRAVWPIVVGGIALVLIGIGGWDLFQERAILQARITELEQNQARTRESAALDAKTVAELEVENTALKLQLDTLYQDYNAAIAELGDTDKGGVEAGYSANAEETGAESKSLTVLEDLIEDPAGSELAPSGTEGWFINIGAYASSQSANTWVLRLENSGYNISVTKIQTAEGTTLNRVRLTGFDSKAVAKNVALELEADYGTGPLWVGALSGAD